MPHNGGVDEQRKKHQPAPQWQRAICPLAKNSMQTASVRNTKNQKIATKPGHHQKPAPLNQPKNNKHYPQQRQNVSVAHLRLNFVSSSESSSLTNTKSPSLRRITVDLCPLR